MSSSRIIKDVGHCFKSIVNLLQEWDDVPISTLHPSSVIEIDENEGIGEEDHTEANTGGQMLQLAREEAEAIRQKAQEDARGIIEEARRHGYEEGFKQGLQDGISQGWSQGVEKGRSEGREEYHKKIEFFEQVVRKAEEKVRRDWLENERVLIDFVKDVARTIVFDALNLQSDVIVKRAVHELSSVIEDKNNVSIRLSSKDAAKIDADEVKNGFKSIELIEDPTLAPGDCVIESPSGIIVSRIRERLERVMNALDKEFERRREDLSL